MLSLADLTPRLLVSFAAMGYTIPALLGEMPPVTINPAPPMALSAKNAASLESPPPPSSTSWQSDYNKTSVGSAFRKPGTTEAPTFSVLAERMNLLSGVVAASLLVPPTSLTCGVKGAQPPLRRG